MADETNKEQELLIAELTDLDTCLDMLKLLRKARMFINHPEQLVEIDSMLNKFKDLKYE